ncbi:hypothetical protein [Streptomyces niveus]|uniref:hypothetical protein n=1 Tax=Streptomyces niveus TaxID=193462 RepID=UPI0036674220
MLLRMVPESQEPIETAVGVSAEQAVAGDMDWFDLYGFFIEYCLLRHRVPGPSG